MHPLWRLFPLRSIRAGAAAALTGIALMALSPATAEAQTTMGMLTEALSNVIKAIGEGLGTVARSQ